MSFFRNKIEEISEMSVSINPAIQTGWVAHSKDIISQEIESNPFFLPFSGMCLADTATLLESDSIKSGLSIMLKDLSASRQENIMVNPKFTNTITLGDGTGKIGQIDTKGQTAVIADVMFSGNNNQNPTVVGLQAIPKQISTSTQSTNQDVQNNTPITGVLSDTATSPFNPFGPSTSLESTPNTPSNLPSPQKQMTEEEMRKAIQQNYPAPTLDTKTGKIVRPKWNGRGINLNSITTGAILVTNSDLSALTSFYDA